MEVSCYHKDTCLSCYLTDHHNREGELLLGIYPNGQTDEEAVEDLLNEYRVADNGFSIPDDDFLKEDSLRAAFTEAVAGVDFRKIDRDGDRVEEFTDEEEDFPTGESAQVWFVLKWECVTVPKNFPVQPLDELVECKGKMTCGTCKLSWDDSISTGYTPVPAGRCPFEAFHLSEDE